MREDVVNSSNFMDEQEALSALVPAQERINALTTQMIARRAERQSLPLSFAQQRLWFLDQLVPNSTPYNRPYAFKLRGILDVRVFERVLNEVIRRHEALRTNFVSVNGQPVQTIAETRQITLPIVDLQHLPLAERIAKTEHLAMEEAKKPFNLASDALVRTTLLRLDVTEHVFLLTLHHIISDSWSEGVLIKEISTLYEAFLQGRPSPLPELPIQYADFTQWQHQWLQDETGSRLLAYWKRQLNGLSPLELPTDRPRPAFFNYRGSRLTFELSASMADSLKILSKREGVTLFVTLLAAFQTLLMRYGGQNDIAVGSPIANRTRAELEGLIGFFENTLVLRTDLSGNPSFRILLRRVQEMLLEAHAHQDLPFEHLVDEMHVSLDPSRTPLFQMMFVLQKTPSCTVELPGMTLDISESFIGTAKFDLLLSISEHNDKLKGIFEYSTDLFDEATIRRLLGHYQTILEHVVANPELSLASIPLLTTEEQNQLLLDWNETATSFPPARCIHHLIEEQVQRTPSAIAVTFADSLLTYHDLNSRANQLAHHLHHLGVRPGMCVGVHLERSLDAMIAFLGILKAGCAYVPIDPANPGDRVTFMIQNAQIATLLTHQHLVSALLEHQAQLVCLDSDWPTIATAPTTNPHNDVSVANLIYVIYTSGSTGKPKGVAMSHRAMCNLLYWQLETMVPPRAARMLQYTSLSFDVSFQEIFPTLSTGGTIMMISEELRRDPVALLRFISEQQAEKFYLPVVALQQLADASTGLENVQLTCIREITAAGEQLLITPQMIRFFHRATNCTLHNFYGPTETHGTTLFTLKGEPEQWPTVVPIGRPIANDQNYVLDTSRQLLPIGIPGELYLGGVGIADGYFNRPDLTAERFLPDPFSKRPGMRFYKTGDLVRYRSDGNIEFLGRIDHQVKIRGFRVELEEIEAVLNQHPAVRESVVIVREDVPGDKRLVAYLVTEAEQRPTTSELRAIVQAQLPEYMVPAIYMFLDALPLTINRKVDRQRLPKPDRDRPQLEVNFVEPRTSTEQELAQIWLDILRIERVGMHDNFFELGGHSLLATRLISHVHNTCQVELPLRSLFAMPTIAGLAEQIEAARRTQKSIKLSPITRVARTGMLPLSYSQQRLWFLNQWEPQSPVYNEHLALQLTGPLQIVALERSLNEIVHRHEALRTTFVVRKEIPEQVVKPALHVPLPLVDLENMRGAIGTDKSKNEIEVLVQNMAVTEVRRLFDLSQGPLLRTTLLRLNKTKHVLLLTMHHIVSDGWSMGVFFQELAALYAAFVVGKTSPLPDLPIQYADYAVWQRQWLQGDVLEAQLSYWRQHLTNVPTLLNLPTDHPRPSVQSYRGSSISFRIPEEVRAALHRLSQAEGATLFMTLLAAFQVLLHRYSGQEDFLVGTPIANRTREETAGLIGCFINTLVLRGNMAGNPPFRTLLQKVREESLEAYAHQELPFELLVEALQPERTSSYNPLFQVMFVLQNAAETSLELSGLHVQLLEEQEQSSKFDLTLSITENEQAFEGLLEYNSDLFERSTIERLQEHFLVLLQSIVADPDRCVTDLLLLTSQEEHYLLHEVNPSSLISIPPLCVHHLFEAQVERSPDAVALVYGKESLTYHELNRRANALAFHLRSLGVGPEVLVGICVQRSLELVVSLLAVLKAGGAYVPLDPAYPDERLSFILADTQAPVLITQGAIRERFAAYEGTVLCLDALTDKGEEGEANRSVPALTPANLAYVIYTSGSTGNPKGVMIYHQTLVNAYQAWREAYQLETVVTSHLQMANFTFDVFSGDVVRALCSGGRLVLCPEEVRLIPEQLYGLMRREHVVFGDFVPAVFKNLVQYLEENEQILDFMRILLVGSDSWNAEDYRRSCQICGPQTRLVNGYGLTEVTIDSLYFESVTEDVSIERLVPIGRPFINTKAYILDSYLRPVPMGLPGELYMGGEGLARGYLNRPDLTAERFVPNSFSGQAGARLYKTGDLARYRADGNIEFLGRLDHQVKVRGFRIELGEIETALAQHPSVRTALVIAYEVAPGDQRIVAYVVPQILENSRSQETQDITAKELQHFLREKLPGYMLPATIMFLPALPLLPNGKVNRRALPAPEQGLAGAEARLEGPRTPVEEVLVQIWAQVLNHSQFGIHDDFFESGGHSILATQVLARLRRTFKMNIDLQEIFAAKTVAQLAKVLVDREPKPGYVATVARLHQQIAGLSAEEVRARLTGKRGETRS